MIDSFADRDTKRIFQGTHSRRFPVVIQARARLCLERLDAIIRPSDLAAFPSMRLKRLKGSMRGRYSIRVNDQYRVVFHWKDGNADNVRLMDYH